MKDGTPFQSPLSAMDAAALDALVEAGFDPARVGDEHRVRAERLAAALTAIDDGEAFGAGAPGLIDATMTRLDEVTAEAGVVPMLVPDDEEAIDAWVTAGYRSAKVAGSLRMRAERLEAIGDLITGRAGASSLAFPSVGLIDRTMRSLESAPRPQGVEVAGRIGGSRWRVADLVSLAAMLLLASAVLWPIGASIRGHAERTGCQANLGQVASALAGYVGEFREALPMANASMAGQTWWNVGRPEESNSANLYTLHRAGFTTLGQLACSGNASALRTPYCAEDRDWRRHDEVSFSYRVAPIGAYTLPRTRSNAVLLSDRSAVVPLAYQGRSYRPMENSRNHDGRGQNALLADGSVRWLTSPTTPGGDNLWLTRDLEMLMEIGREADREARARASGVPASRMPLRTVEEIKVFMKGTERPTDANDDFVGP